MFQDMQPSTTLLYLEYNSIVSRPPNIDTMMIHQPRCSASRTPTNMRHVQPRSPTPPLPTQIALATCSSIAAGLLMIATPTAVAAPLVEASPAACDSAVTRQHPSPIVSLAALLDIFGNDRDPVEPFTLFGTTSKKYVIEQLDGEKIVARRKGITVQTCVAGYASSELSPELNGAATRDKVYSSPLKTCRKSEGQDLPGTCEVSCQKACTEGLDKYANASDRFTGFRLPGEDKARVVRSCVRSCTYECTKPGKVGDGGVGGETGHVRNQPDHTQAFDFVIPFRR